MSEQRQTYTLDANGQPLTIHQDGVSMPADHSFACVNDYVHDTGRHFEELQCLALGMACEIDKLRAMLSAAPAAPVAEGHEPGLYAIRYRDNWDGEGDVYHLIAERTEDGRWLNDQSGRELLEYQGDAVLAAWPLTAGTTSDKYRAELHDETWGKARSMGYGNVTEALAELARMKAAEQPDIVRVPVETLQHIHRDLDACQKVIWLAGCRPFGYGFDPAYVTEAQARLKEIDALLSKEAAHA